MVYIARVMAAMDETARECDLLLAELRASQKMYLSAGELAERLNMPAVARRFTSL